MKISRRFTDPKEGAYQTTRYQWRKSTIFNADGSAASRSIEVEVPEQWSQLATDILAQKYLRRCDVPQTDKHDNPITDEKGNPVTGGEQSVRQIVDRLAGCWKNWGDEHGYFDTPQDGRAFYDEVAYMLLHQMAAPNSPQWFNTGLASKYGIKGAPQGHWFIDPKSGELKAGEDSYTHPQPHACFIQSVSDDMLGDGGIYDLLAREGRIFKFGSGTGTNFSNLRAAGERLGSGGVSSGLMSFLKIYDRAAGAIKSGGTTRRAAKMVCLDLDHPEIEDFISWKAVEERKVAALVAGSRAMRTHLPRILAAVGDSDGGEDALAAVAAAVQAGLRAGLPPNLIQRVMQLGEQGVRELDLEEIGTDFEGPGYSTVSGQNSNNSVRVPNHFMSELLQDGDWNLTARTTGETTKTLPARELWNRIAQAAWDCADPGIQYDDTINEWHTCPRDGRIRGSNPCSEYMFLDDTACNLASLNLARFLDEKGDIRIEDFRHAVRLWTLVLEISVTMAQFPSKSIARRSYDYRTLGLGYANLGSVMMKLGIPYHSAEATAFTGCLTAILTGEAYAASAEIARDRGPFPRYEANSEDMLRVIRNHRRAAYDAPPDEYEGLTIRPVGLQADKAPAALLEAARGAWDRALEMGRQYGYCNAQVSVIAPTGTIGLLMDCDTTGIEPDFALVKYKKLSGGGYFKIVNQSIAPALSRMGYSRQQIRDIEAYCIGHGRLDGSPHIHPQTLLERGFTPEILDKVNQALPNCTHILQAFSPHNLGAEFLEKTLGIAPARWKEPGFDALLAMGFKSEEIEAANVYACGTQTIEGAPHLMQEHYPVFDCANQCGAGGTRFIPPEGHLAMMAAAQPFISGALSKTINLPSHSTVDAVKAIYRKSWELGLKAVALYRDGSKLSQPLGSESILPEILKLAHDGPQAAGSPEPVRPPSETQAAEQATTAGNRRRKLLPRRGGFVQEATVGGHKIYLRTGEYPDGQLGEIFIDMYKEGAGYRSLLNCFAVLTSKALQYGVPLTELVDSFTFTRFDPSGPVSGHEHIKSSTSILDFVFRTLGHHYLDIQEFLHVKPALDYSPSVNKSGQKTTQKDSVDKKREGGPGSSSAVLETTSHLAQSGIHKAYSESRRAGYTGDSCGSCGSMRMRRNGTCMVCEDCGSTSGCS